jgi:hypothetical protein
MFPRFLRNKKPSGLSGGFFISSTLNYFIPHNSISAFEFVEFATV